MNRKPGTWRAAALAVALATPVYGKAGIAMGRVASLLTADDNACLPRCTFTGEAIHVGLTVGAGMAFALSPSWILGLEYDYYDLGLENYGGGIQRVEYPG